MCNQIYVLFTFLLYYYLGVGVGEVVCLPVFSFSFFLQDLKSTPPPPPASFAAFFLLSPSFQRMFLLALCPCLPAARAFRLQPRFAPTSESLPRCLHRSLPGLCYSLSYFRLTLFPAMVSTQLLAATSFPSSLIATVFPGLVPKVWRIGLLTFGINFFFTYRWFEEYVIFDLLVIRRVWVLCSFSYCPW